MVSDPQVLVIRVELSRLIVNERSNEQVIWVQETDGERGFPILVGVFEIAVIDRHLRDEVHARPLTHDLLGSVLSELGGELEHVVIDDVQGETFFAKLHVRQGDVELKIDARPSDAIALALRADRAIFVADEVMNTVCSG